MECIPLLNERVKTLSLNIVWMAVLQFRVILCFGSAAGGDGLLKLLSATVDD